jgi:hypothetical protein
MFDRLTPLQPPEPRRRWRAHDTFFQVGLDADVVGAW